MAWYIARSLDVLLGQLNALAPRRNKASDGGIGDPAHSARTSDHNPTSTGQVCARDYTHDPAGGLDCNWLANVLVASRDSRIKYIIWNRRILDTRPGFRPWTWQPYTGTNPHTKHLHLSVKAGAVGDNASQWNLGGVQGEREMELSDNVTLFDGTKTSVNNVLAGILARLGKQQSLEYPHVYADTPEFVTAIDQNVIHVQRQTERIDDIEVKVDAVIQSLNTLMTKVNELLAKE